MTMINHVSRAVIRCVGNGSCRAILPRRLGTVNDGTRGLHQANECRRTMRRVKTRKVLAATFPPQPEQEQSMTTYKVGYFIGSLATASINRQLAKALIKLAPPELTFTEIPIRDLPLQLRLRRRLPAGGARFQEGHCRSRCHPVRHTRIQPLHTRRPEERNRLGQPAVRAKFLRAQAFSRHRHLAWRHWHRGGAATPAQRAGILQFSADELARGLYPVQPDSSPRTAT